MEERIVEAMSCSHALPILLPSLQLEFSGDFSCF